MGFRKRDEGPELPDEFGDGLSIITVLVDGHKVRLVPMNQLPISRMMPIMAETDGMRQLLLLIELMKSALLDPKDWENYLEHATLETMQRVIGDWTATIEDEPEKRHGKKKSR